MLDFVLACARKEPHYRIYFLAFAWYYAGKTLLRPDCDAPAGSATPEPFVSIPTFLNPSSPRNNYFYDLSSALWTLCKSATPRGRGFDSPVFHQNQFWRSRSRMIPCAGPGGRSMFRVTAWACSLGILEKIIFSLR